jgi:hypothetical protein
MHDNSKQIDYWKDLIEFISSQDYMEQKEVGYDSRTIIYPLNIKELKLVDSKEHKQVQIADLVASSTAFVLKDLVENRNDDFAMELRKTKLFNMKYHLIAPSNAISPKELGMEKGDGENQLDYFVEMVLKSKDKYNEIESKLKKG